MFTLTRRAALLALFVTTVTGSSHAGAFSIPTSLSNVIPDAPRIRRCKRGIALGRQIDPPIV